MRNLIVLTWSSINLSINSTNSTTELSNQQVTDEKNELQDENSTLQNQIEKLQNVLNERMPRLNLDLNTTPPEQKELDFMPLNGKDHLMLPTVEQPESVTPVFVIPVHSGVQVYREPDYTAQVASKPCVRKPHARYPCPDDSWPSHLLQKQRG